MSTVDRPTAHLVLAAIRVLAHCNQRSPKPEDVAELLGFPAATIRVYVTQLQELGAVVLVDSAFETHLEIRDHRCVEELVDAPVEALAKDLEDFDRRKQAEAEQMARLFEDGTFAQERQDKLDQMGAELRRMPSKPRNPFGDDDGS